MARRRKTHVQQELRWHNAAGDLRGRKREAPSTGHRRGKRKLGRPRKPGARQRHEKRPVFASERVVHITLRAERAVGGLRTRACYRAIREAVVTMLPHDDCRIVQLSIQRTHVHLLVETDSSRALSRGMQAFQISAAKHINAAVSGAGSWWERRRMASPPKRRKGRVFTDRYFARLITSPLQARRELAYVLNNWRKHGEDHRAVARGWRIDPFSTGWAFVGWSELEHEQWAWSKPPLYEPIPVHAARSWLMRVGWKRYGGIGMREVPSARTVTTRAP